MFLHGWLEIGIYSNTQKFVKGEPGLCHDPLVGALHASEVEFDISGSVAILDPGTTNLGVRSSNLFGRASRTKHL
jgi:hypothetical protein